METMRGETVFLDTNVLLTATDRSRRHHDDARRILELANRSGIHLALSGQVLREYLVVATRPQDANGLGLSAEDALANAAKIRSRAVLCEETAAVTARLESLVRIHNLTGRRIHDANIVATMQAHGVSTLVSDNAGDFEALAGVTLLGIPEALRVMAAAAGQA